MKIVSLPFEQMDQRVRATFINCLSGFKSANLVGTYSLKDQTTNLSMISSAFHLGANPALMGFIVRPHSTDRHTLEYILETQEFTLNHVNEEIVNLAHQTSARYDRGQCEFKMTGLTPLFHQELKAPFVSESNIRMYLKLREHHHLNINKTEMIIGEITHVFAPDDAVLSDGSLNLEQAGTICVSGLDRYHKTQQITRLSYAKPDQPLKEIDESTLNRF
jgi:flavin reductase (DIM6/NTAB) family NADH-FMN oxidoreductase RutF